MSAAIVFFGGILYNTCRLRGTMPLRRKNMPTIRTFIYSVEDRMTVSVLREYRPYSLDVMRVSVAVRSPSWAWKEMKYAYSND